MLWCLLESRAPFATSKSIEELGSKETYFLNWGAAVKRRTRRQQAFFWGLTHCPPSSELLTRLWETLLIYFLCCYVAGSLACL